MQPRIFESAQCIICGEVSRRRFRDPVIFCDRHQRDEIDFHQSLQDGPLRKDQKAQIRLFEKRWKEK